MTKEQVMFGLLRREICGDTVELGQWQTDHEQLSARLLSLYRLSKSHDVAHLVADALADMGLLGQDEVSARFKKQQMLAVYRYENLNYELESVCQALEKEKISFLPLKGSVIRVFYPAPWMRTSCDIDILVHEEELDRAASVLEASLGYVLKERSSHDISLFSPGGVHLELHFNLIEEVRYPVAVAILSDVWQYATSVKEDSYRYVLSDEMFYFYHIAHMAKHFESGGCGVRPFLDLWILEHRLEHDREKRNALLAKGGLLTFAEVCRQLTEVWFSGLESDPLTEEFGRFVLDGGVYGTVENNIIVNQQKKGGRVRYVWSRLFVPYEILKDRYPILRKHPVLLPVCQLRRWAGMIKGGRLERSVEELRLSGKISQTQEQSTAELLSRIGL